ncbi:hypothetical protein LPJ66_006314, partial [Kickxella alabastrina]
LLIIVKFGRGEFTEPFPRLVIVFWSSVVGLIVAFSLWQFAIKPRLWPDSPNSLDSGGSSDGQQQQQQSLHATDTTKID